jgi:hypothetical protein
MAQVLVRNSGGPFFYGNVRERGQEVEVENDETHWVGHDFFSDPSKLFQGFRLSVPVASAERTETVDKNESIAFRNLLRPGVTLPILEFAHSTTRTRGLRLQGITVNSIGTLPDGGRFADMTAKSIIAIRIGL